ncbi:MAG: OmpA family protein, partial [Acidobacteriota bacterium]
MTARRPMLDDLELDHAQRVDEAAEHARPRHGVPGLEGDFLQHTGRRARRVTVEGVASGHAAAHRLAALRERFRRREPVPFVSDVVTATEVGDVLIEDLAIRELAGRPASFAYALTLRQFLEPPAAEQTEPPEIEPPTLPDDPIDEDLGTLIVDVVVIGPEDFDRGQITVTARGTEAGGAPFSRTLARQGDAATPADRAPWTDAEMPAGDYSVEAIAQIGGEARADGAEVTVRPGQTAPVTLTLAVGGAGSPVARAFIVHFHFDRGFIEPCLRPVMRQVAEHAAAHPRDKLLIVGHTDRSGSEAYNQSLSERRARSAYAYLTAGRDPAARAAALAEWQLLRQRRPGGELPSARDSWGLREDQFMLQDLGFYPGRIDGRDGPLTEDAVRAFRCRKGLPPGTARDDAFGAALIEDYLDQDALALAEERLFPNARAAGPGSPCDGGRTRWLGCGELSPLPEPTPTRASAWRPYRRVEFLFVRAEELPSPVLRPETLDLQPPSGEAQPGPPQTWCFDPQGQGERCAFATLDPGRAGSPGPWLVRPAEEGTLSVAGTITNEDGTPFARERFVLIAPDGRILRGEGPQGQRITGRTDAAGSFRFDDLVPGFYSLEVHRGVLARLAEHPDSEVRGSSVCKALRAASDRLDVVVTAAPVLRE